MHLLVAFDSGSRKYSIKKETYGILSLRIFTIRIDCGKGGLPSKTHRGAQTANKGARRAAEGA